ncbi:L-prolyl-[peptidyl-carrier protein] dehydrogenase [Streptomyces caeni]|uniref:L-prolyl-[peptidyl-carrier protein] dehydrogenase n=1 Tax=Streptomyces caeni TaxID=2307231 RepID=A0ABW4IVD6_9ACTN
MNFEYDTDTAQMRDMVVNFARRDLSGPCEWDAADFRRRWQLAGKQGLAGATIPGEYGGSGLGAVAAAAMMEALGEGCADTGFAFSLAAHLFAAVMPIADFGTEEQRHRWLPGLCSGDLVAAHAITEPEAGSDALSLQTRAVRHGNGYVLDGEKCFVTNAPAADIFVVQACTDPDAGYFGLTTFVVEAGTAGLSVGPPYPKVGLRGSPTADVHFDGCVVTEEQVLGRPGAGASVFSSSMAWERTCLFAVYLGAMRRVIDGTVAYVNEREQFGAAVGSFQAVSHRIVDMTLRLESARLMLFRAAWGLDRGDRDEVAPALAKLAVSEAAVQTGLDAVQLHGGLGVVDGPAETLLRDALPSRIFSGTNEIQRNNIARALGLGARRRPVRRA